MEGFKSGTAGILEKIPESPQSEGFGDLLEDLLDVRSLEKILIRIALAEFSSSRRSELLPHAVIFPALFGVGKDSVRFVDLAHLFRGFRIVLVAVRMVFQCQIPVSGLDLLGPCLRGPPPISDNNRPDSCFVLIDSGIFPPLHEIPENNFNKKEHNSHQHHTTPVYCVPSVNLQGLFFSEKISLSNLMGSIG